MNTRDFATNLFLSLQAIRAKLDSIENCEDGMEMIDIAQELAADIERLEEDIESEFDLGMAEQ